ncbi:MAG: hypothetical protein GY943_35775, partial [Chloroflexi bacterium]|nr:hypothetical protein [Chloroflexota bacterium]
ELPGGVVTYDLSYSNDGTITSTNVLVTDTIPSSLIVTSIDISPANNLVAGFYEVNSSPGVWLPFPGNNYAVTTNVPVTTTATAFPGDIELAPGEYLTGVSFDVGMVGMGTSWSSTVNTIIDPAIPVGVTIPNCIDTVATWDDNGAPQQTSQNECSSVETIDLRAIPRVGKSTTDDSLQPGDVTRFTLTASNAAVAHNNVIGPITLVDMLPKEFELVIPDATEQSGYRLPTVPELLSSSWYSFTTTDGAPNPVHTVTPDFGGGDKDLLRWEWAAPYEQAPGNVLTIQFYARIKEYMPPQTIGNQAIILTGPSVNPLGCSGQNLYTDALDVDEDLNTSEEGCKFTSNVKIETFLSLDSQKFVWGELDPNWNDYGYTIAGGDVDYRLVITNTGNITATNIIVYDILPFVGDTGVVDTSSRGSTWRPNLQAPIVYTGSLPLTISYSQQENPCRIELKDNGPAGCVDDWSTTPPVDITSVQSVRFEFCNGGTCAELAPPVAGVGGGSLEFTWHMVAPNDAPHNIVAWNSFGYTAEGGGLQLLPSEPIRVGIQLKFNTEPGVSIGDYVWYDLYGDQDDGIQQPQEEGVNGVRVELWDNNTSLLVDYRVTGLDVNGDDGFYQFVDIPAGDYYLRFFPPTGYTASPPNLGGDDALDSDGETAGTDPTYGDYVETAVFTVTVPNDDFTWDQGIWRPTDYGDAPNNYPTESASLGANPELAARHIISPTMYMGASVDAELDGQPNINAWGDDDTDAPDDEDGVTFPHYLGTVANPLGIMIHNESSNITVQTVVPITDTGYLNAWIDFNGDGDWDDPGEQIATDLVTTGGSETISVSVPGTAVYGKTYARFRLSTQPGLLPTGTAPDGEVEDYQVQFVPQPVKSIISTSEAHTSDSPSRLAIGEIIRYRLQVSVPEGTMTNFEIQDRLRDGMQYLDDGTATVTVTADTSIVHDPMNVPGSPFTNGEDPVFELGTVINSDNDTDEEFVTVEFNALV